MLFPLFESPGGSRNPVTCCIGKVSDARFIPPRGSTVYRGLGYSEVVTEDQRVSKGSCEISGPVAASSTTMKENKKPQ